MIVVTAYASSRRDEIFWVFLGWAVSGVCLPDVSLVSGCLVRWLVGRKLTGVYFSWLLLTSGDLGNVVLGLLHVLAVQWYIYRTELKYQRTFQGIST
jgi:hypothetical protein